MTYTVAVLHEADGRFSAIVPALPGCATWGDTFEEAIDAVGEAIGLYLDTLRDFGDPLPKDQEVFTLEVGDATDVSVQRVTVFQEEVAQVA